MLQGKLVIFEGPDGVGKTTLVDKTCQFMDASKIPYKIFSFPGKTQGTLGAHIYHLHHNWDKMGISSMDPASLQTLHIAAHIDAIENQIIPCLKDGYNILLDRFWWSTWVYGLVSGVKEESVRAMVALELVHWGKYLPHALFLIRNTSPLRDDVVDESWNSLMSGYDSLAQGENCKYPIHSINTDCPIDDTFQQIKEVVLELGL